MSRYAEAAVFRPSDGLFEGCVAGDDDAIAEFYKRYQPKLLSYAARKGAEDPEGVADLAVVNTLRRLADMQRLEAPMVEAYLYRTVKNQLIDEHRAAPAATVSLEEHGIDVPRDGSDQVVLDRAAFIDLVDHLTPAQREVVSHRFVGGLNSVEIGERVGRSPAAVRRLQANAMARLRLILLASAACVFVVGAAYWLTNRHSEKVETGPVGESPQVEGSPARDRQDVTQRRGVPTPRPDGDDAVRPGSTPTTTSPELTTSTSTSAATSTSPTTSAPDPPPTTTSTTTPDPPPTTTSTTTPDPPPTTTAPPPATSAVPSSSTTPGPGRTGSNGSAGATSPLASLPFSISDADGG